MTVGARRVVTLLDLIWLHQRAAWGTPAAVRTMAIFTRVSAKTANRVITISESARDDIVRNFGLDASRVDVTPLGVRIPLEIPPRRVDGPPVILTVAQKRPYKNLGSLIRAVADLPDEQARLILPGAPTDHEAELRALAEGLGVSDRVQFPAWVSAEELEGLYPRRRRVFCFRR